MVEKRIVTGGTIAQNHSNADRRVDRDRSRSSSGPVGTLDYRPSAATAARDIRAAPEGRI